MANEEKRRRKASDEAAPAKKRKKNSVDARQRRGKDNPFSPEARKANSKKMRKQYVVAVIVCLAVIAGLVFWQCTKTNDNVRVPDGEEVTEAFPYGFLSVEYSETLYERGLISSQDEFNQEVADRGCAADLKPGAYVFVGGTPTTQIIDQLLEGPNATFAIEEGDTLQDIADKIDACYNHTVKADRMMEKFTNLGEYYDDYPFLKGHDDMDGFLLPGTYDAQVFGTMEFDTSRANMITEQILNVYAESHGYPTVDYAKPKE